jgi:hypothetical protein
VNRSDNNGDGGSTNTWKTITHALDQVTDSGVGVRSASGTYDQALGENFPMVWSLILLPIRFCGSPRLNAFIIKKEAERGDDYQDSCRDCFQGYGYSVYIQSW